MQGLLLAALFAASSSTSTSAMSDENDLDVKVTQKYLVPVCLDGSRLPDAKGPRRFRLTLAEHTLAFTMRNEPRHPATASVSPGFALVRFTPRAGHRYEIEVRAEPGTFSSRVWNRGEWKPVVRDRTTEEIVSTPPEWREDACH
jgi:hypothetical protein